MIPAANLPDYVFRGGEQVWRPPFSARQVELYGFVMPGLTPDERRAVRPLLAAVPVLFVCGVLFAYFVVLPAAVRFLRVTSNLGLLLDVPSASGSV